MFIYKTAAIKVAGSQKKLADALGISKQAVHQWKPRNPIPQKQAMKLVKIYGEEAFR
jgi:DNA-binding transcriptional regulator YiaG